MALEHITDMVATAASRVLWQYKNLPRFTTLMAGNVGQVQSLEDAMWAIVPMLDINQATGAWLDLLGAFVGEPRDGAEDDDYRRFIAARILANGSTATIEEILAVALLVCDTAPPGIGFKLKEWVTLAMRLTVPFGSQQMGGQQGVILLNRLLKLLRSTRGGAVKLNVKYQDCTDDDVLTAGDATGVKGNVGKPCGDASLVGSDQPNAGRCAGVSKA